MKIFLFFKDTKTVIQVKDYFVKHCWARDNATLCKGFHDSDIALNFK